jgi:hypothetical protein
MNPEQPRKKGLRTRVCRVCQQVKPKAGSRLLPEDRYTMGAMWTCGDCAKKVAGTP